MSDISTVRGRAAETLAAHYLEARGLQLLQRNYRCRHGEIDLVMRDEANACLVFVEVRYRQRSRYGGAAASVTAGKRLRLARTVLHYLQHQRLTQQQRVRVDVIAVRPGHTATGKPESTAYEQIPLDAGRVSIQWLPNIDLPLL